MTTPSLTLVGYSRLPFASTAHVSPHCLKAERALRYGGVPFRVRSVDSPEEIHALNPLGQLPVLLVDGNPLPDSSRILEYADASCSDALTPADPRVAAEAWLWEELGDTVLTGFVMAARWVDDENFARVREVFFGRIPEPMQSEVANDVRARLVRDVQGRDIARSGLAAAWRRLHALLDRLDARAPVEGFWLGDAPSVADFGLFAPLQNLRVAELTPEQAAWVEARPTLRAWLDRVDELGR